MRIARLVDLKRPSTLEGMEFHVDLPIVGIAMTPLELTFSGWVKDFDRKLLNISVQNGAQDIAFSRVPRPDLTNGSSNQLLGYEFGLNLNRLKYPEALELYAKFEGTSDRTLLCTLRIDYA